MAASLNIPNCQCIYINTLKMLYVRKHTYNIFCEKEKRLSAMKTTKKIK